MEESDDDLLITNVVSKDLQDAGAASGSKTESDDGRLKQAKGKARVQDGELEGVKVAFSDDDDDPESAYQKFKHRNSARRKRAPVSEKESKSRKGNTIVGKRSRRDGFSAQGSTKRQRDYGDESNEDDALMEYTLPDHIQDRRAEFEKSRERLKDAGLKLPPDYDGIDFFDDDRLENLKERPDFPMGKPASRYEDIILPHSLGIIPAPIAQWLRDYQVKGAAFLHELFVYQRGGILGDDMGLGKTIQVIAFLAAAYGKTGDERDGKRMRKMRRAGDDRWYPITLIICPGTLIENWRAELERWGWWHVDIFHGDTKVEALEAAKTGRTEIMITTYTTYRLNREAINLVDWDCVIADECHVIKERSSEITKSMVEINALCRIGLSGTAIQNKYEELWTLLNWTNPGHFGPISTWRTSISDPLKIGQSHDATISQLSKARKTAKKLVENLLPEYFLRRMKSLIADQLPKKTDRVVFCPLTPTQAEAYESYLDSDIVAAIRISSESCPCGSGHKAGWCCHQLVRDKKWQQYVFPAIMNLQKLSNHLALLIPQGSDARERQEKDLETLELAVPEQWRELYRNRDSIVTFSNPEFCGKWKVLKKLLRFWHGNGDKVLVFSHSVRLLKMLQTLFTHTSYNVSYLDGAMSYEERSKTVDDFNSDPTQFVFLISTRAGGVGLNITSANKVVVVDPNWNPSYDLQAQDRAYRIGQLRDVEVFRLVSAGTIEEIVYARQIYKQQQANIGYNASMERRYFRGVQEKHDQKGEIFGLRNLFSYQGDNIVLREIVNKTNVAESKAGVAVVGLDLDDDDADNDGDPLNFRRSKGSDNTDEDRAMSQLAALVTGEADLPSDTAGGGQATPKGNKKVDAVQAILAGAGVEYTHENSEVVGSSKIETRLSKRAQEAGNDVDMAQEYVFQRSSQVAQSEDAPFRYRYRPPPQVMKRQFCTMAKEFGFTDPIEFAFVVESWTAAQRRNCLDKFYKARRERLGSS
ncbi:SNF2 family N-terminal domain-containing protein [Xylona heveae TC161]|uniref:SNF2 family N-terminal domain-containing protein n=1 Tax=Xylona heveae (strain CBS 132557 / TC161) TaxID=1328760 RepID=A0A165I5U1_XYLHT|nr:SNF2 family N-terminal domain-containing protein [Xylona heveae TC161]KZF24429.1 SNF2 family N-terminal domain-containing protein [Xylona heveae TC161]